MDLVVAHTMIAARKDSGRSLLPEEISFEADDGSEPVAPLVTAQITLSGMLDDAVTDDDLDEAAAHFRSLLNAGVFTLEQWSEEAHDVIRQIVERGKQSKSEAP